MHTSNLLCCYQTARLKAVGGNQTISSLVALAIPRRIILTGTPIQNNLQVRLV